MADSQAITTDEWQEHWLKHKSVASWDYLSQIILDVLLENTPSSQALNYLEAGSGTGRISLRLAGMGNNVRLVDISEAAQQISKKLFKDAGHKGKFHNCSVTDMPFEDGSFDVVWNAGLLEHFSHDEQKEILCEMTRVCADGGLVIMFNPCGTSPFFKVGLFISNILRTWPYGFEAQMRDSAGIVEGLSIEVEKEYKAGFFVIFVEGFRFIPGFSWATLALRKLFIALSISPIGGFLSKCDRILSRLLGGYLLVSIMKKKRINEGS